MVLANQAVVGSVNANRRHYEAAAEALAAADHGVAGQAGHPDGAARHLAEALDRHPDDVKVVIEIDQ